MTDRTTPPDDGNEDTISYLRRKVDLLSSKNSKLKRASDFWKGITMIAMIASPSLIMIAIIVADLFLKWHGKEALETTVATSIAQSTGSVQLAATTGILGYIGGRSEGKKRENVEDEK